MAYLESLSLSQCQSTLSTCLALHTKCTRKAKSVACCHNYPENINRTAPGRAGLPAQCCSVSQFVFGAAASQSSGYHVVRVHLPKIRCLLSAPPKNLFTLYLVLFKKTFLIYKRSNRTRKKKRK